MKRWLTPSLLLVVVSATAKQPLVPAAPPLTPAPAAELKVLSWNIYMLPGIVPLKARRARACAIADTLEHSDYDIVVFQEAFHQGAVHTLRTRLADRFPFMYGPFNTEGPDMRYSSGVFVLSRLPLRVLGTIAFDTACSFDRRARKGAALLEGERNGRTFQVVGTHLQADDHPAIRARQLQELFAGLLAPFRRDGVPQIICGDMNTAREQDEYDAMLCSLDAQDGPAESAQQQSYDAGTNHLAHRVWSSARTTLDYVLLRLNGAALRSVHRRVSVMKRHRGRHREDLSDHYGVACELLF